MYNKPVGEIIKQHNIKIISDMLKLNKDKTEFLGCLFSSKQHVKKTENLHIKGGSSYINSSMPVRNVVIILEKQVNSICKSCYY